MYLEFRNLGSCSGFPGRSLERGLGLFCLRVEEGEPQQPSGRCRYHVPRRQGGIQQHILKVLAVCFEGISAMCVKASCSRGIRNGIRVMSIGASCVPATKFRGGPPGRAATDFRYVYYRFSRSCGRLPSSNFRIAGRF